MLDILSIFLDETSNLNWCHWKSNVRLEQSLSGETDLDILVDSEQIEIFKIKLKKCKFFELKSLPWNNYSGVTNWIGHDANTGKLIHIHLHERLLTGLKSVKDYSLPWTKLFLEATIKDKNSGFPIIPPALEVHLLMARELAKTSIISRYYFLKFKKTIIDRFIIEEMRALLNLSKNKDIILWGNILWENNNSREISKILISKDWSEFRNLNKLSKLTHNILNQYTNKSWYISFLLKVLNVSYRNITLYLSNFFEKFSTKMTLKKKAPIIAIIGCDGSGKTSLNDALQRWLDWKVESKTLYLGSKDNLIRILEKIFKNNKSKRILNIKKDIRNKNFIKLFFSIYSAQIKLFKLKKAKYLSSKGKIILTDRFPQNEFLGHIYDSSSDLSINQLSLLERIIFKYEKFIFQKIYSFKPDLIIKLLINPKVAKLRKPNHDFEVLMKKCSVFEKLNFEGIHKIDIDANQEFEDVLKRTKNEVWEFINSKNKNQLI